MEIKAPEPKTCRPRSNLTFNGSIKKVDEPDYQDCREFLYLTHQSIGEYLVNSYRELDKPSFRP